MNISVVIPAYNEETDIKHTVLGVKDVMTHAGIRDYEVIVVDDHSDDKTFDLVTEFGEKNINCIRLSRRSGSHTALRAGLSISRGDVVLCISADGQDDIGIMPDMIKKWKGGAKIVWALRKDRKSEAWYIRKVAQFFYRILFLLGESRYQDIDFSRADFFMLDRIVVNAINACPEKNTSLFGLIAWLGFSGDFIEYTRRPRITGKTKWSFKRRLHLAKDWIMAFSGLPLKMISVMGICVAMLGFAYGIYVIINAIVGHPAPGWSSIMAAIFILGGIQMVMLGIIGEYLWRNLDESRRRPLYFIEASAKNTDKDSRNP